MIDDSGLFHGTYDPVKAREYYLRTRKLKGRHPGAGKPSGQGRGGHATKAVAVRGGGRPNRANTKSRRAELEAQKAALEKRLERLHQVLKEKVAAAKKRSGAPKPKEHVKDAAPETKADVADRNKAQKNAKPLTAAQKSTKAKAAKKAYEKEHPNSLSEDIVVLKEQIKDIRAKIEKAISDAQAQHKKAGPAPRALVRPQPKPNDGPQGR